MLIRNIKTVQECIFSKFSHSPSIWRLCGISCKITHLKETMRPLRVSCSLNVKRHAECIQELMKETYLNDMKPKFNWNYFV